MIRLRNPHHATTWTSTDTGLRELSSSSLRAVAGGGDRGESCRWDGDHHHRRRGHWDDRHRWHWDRGWC